MSKAPDGRLFGLGFDAGGSQTRWALADQAGHIVSEGVLQGFSALQMESAAGRLAVDAALAELARQLPAQQRPARVHAGLTGFGGDCAALRGAIAAALGLDAAAVTVGDDIEIAYHDAFAPGAGYLVYAGTGSIAVLIEADGVVHRAGGRGVVLDDGGGGFWIAREAMRHIWRAEDELPGCWRASPMAVAMFEQIGGSDWSITRRIIYTGERGDVGRLALAVAKAAATDPVAQRILEQAGRELARIGLALTNRFGVRPFALSGRVPQLHPLIESSFRAALPANAVVTLRASQAHHAAAGIALRAAGRNLPQY